jgi:putative ABC transport system permease protein
MRALDLKLFRDLRGMTGQVVAVALVMACGIAMMIMARSLIVSLEVTSDAYYSSHRFADVFCELKRAPNAVRSRLAEISGVASIDTRVKGGLILDLPGIKEPADGVILSLPDDRPQRLNLLFLRSGRLPRTGIADEVVVGEAFAGANGFDLGDAIDVTIYGGKQRLRIVGIALSPEYIFETRAGESIPDNRRFGVFWINERELAKALDLEGAFNNVQVALGPGADRRAVMGEIDRILEPYGGMSAYDRSNHPSAKALSDRLRVLGGFSIAFPAVFLSVAAFMTSAMLTRIVRLQREQIAQLKAFGYSAGEVGIHYLKFALVIVAIGTVAGSGIGLWLGREVVVLYRRFFLFPELSFHPAWMAVAAALAASGATSFLGVLGALRQAMSLPPAEAMRPEPPADFKPSALERLGLQRLVPPLFRMALRNIERKPWHSFFTAFGLALATAIPIVPGAMRDGIARLMEFQWSAAQRQDITLGLIEPGSFSAWSGMGRLPGVLSAEPFRTVAATIGHGQRERRVSITGLAAGSRLNRLLDENGDEVALPLAGVLLSAKLAELLGVRGGDTVRFEVMEGRRPAIETVVTGTVTDFTGLGAYMEIGFLQRLLGEGGTVSGAHLKVDLDQWDDLLARVKASPRIGATMISREARDSFDRTTGQMMGTVQAIYFGFAVIVAFGVVYNGARIALSERSRDLATMRVVGFTHREVAAVLIGELALLTFLALLPGLVIGTQFAGLLVASASTETLRMPLVLTSRTYATAVLIVLCSSMLSFAVVSRRIHELDLIGVLKAQE